MMETTTTTTTMETHTDRPVASTSGQGRMQTRAISETDRSLMIPMGAFHSNGRGA